jgi:hypothetical protein
MNAQIARKMLYTSFTLLVMIIQTGCAGTAKTASSEPALPTETAILNTATPMATATLINTSTPEATVTSTNTPAPTPTFTPDVTATQLPEITPAVEGKGNVVGLVLWNGQPVAKAAVWLCEKFEGACKGVYQYRANTDDNGYYIFKNVTPGKYLVAINSFSTSWFIFYFDTQGNRMQTVSAGENLILEPWNIWKLDLKPIAPKSQQVLSNPRPVFKWEAYPDADYYQIFIQQYNPHDLNSVPKIVANIRVDGTEFTPEEDFISCQYFWQVDAYNAQGIKISQMHPDQYGGLMYFTNADLPTRC